MYSLIYASSAVQPFTPAELQNLLQVSRRNNELCDVTGMLLYKDGNFMQVLEGERAAVTAVQQKIATDPRHHGIIVLLSRDTPERQFPSWSMAFRDLDRHSGSRTLAGYDEFLNTPLNDGRFARDSSACQRLLSIFKRDM